MATELKRTLSLLLKKIMLTILQHDKALQKCVSAECSAPRICGLSHVSTVQRAGSSLRIAAQKNQHVLEDLRHAPIHEVVRLLGVAQEEECVCYNLDNFIRTLVAP